MRTAQTQAYLEFSAARAGHLFRSACLLASGDTHLAEDLVQETLGRMYVVWGRIAKVDNPAAYAQTVLVRAFLTHRRRSSSRESPSAELPDRLAGAGGDTLLRVTLLTALAELGPKDRAVLVLRYWEDRSIEETAEVLQTSAGAVRTRSVRALSRLRAELGGSLRDLAGQ
ncbi:RNA polymerase sigma-70 factor, sigma-E family [Streptomyces sp. DvalAA-14]|uniref:SigE family RNA polymerase sigma factor n=1 Tax=Streptomyces sp. SID4948 TaxID=2690287 RepID=UPI00081B9613|nr:SigE family RNA polymerase sigma factor [Streptomyces sp. DvalAA-14]MYS23338.1 SigE family RNA polymerase sigma factor [Streptomyces sp. SID4948]SCE31871.1 RNA polymerase sigma-70 factor, sigma-E family [Streptomyces sp. DvalAA-14]